MNALMSCGLICLLAACGGEPQRAVTSAAPESGTVLAEPQPPGVKPAPPGVKPHFVQCDPDRPELPCTPETEAIILKP